MTRPAVEVWVLRGLDYTKRPVWYECWTGIGPCSTPVLEDAERFSSRQDAALSRAMRHGLSRWEPETLESANRALSQAPPAGAGGGGL